MRWATDPLRRGVPTVLRHAGSRPARTAVRGPTLILCLLLAGGAPRAEEKETAEEKPAAGVIVQEVLFPEDVAENLSALGGWIPVYLELKAVSRAPERVVIEAGVWDGTKSVFTAREAVEVLPGAPRRAWVYLRAGAGKGREIGSLEVRTGQGVTITKHLDLPLDSQPDSSRTLSLLVVGEGLGDLKPWAGDLTRPRGPRSELRESAVGCAPWKLPDRATGYGAFDIVILRGTGGENLEPAQLAALGAWVRWGGFLVIVPSTLSGEVFRTKIARDLLGGAHRDAKPVDGFEPKRIHAVTRESLIAAIASQPIFDVDADREERAAAGREPPRKLTCTLLDPLAERGEREIRSVEGPLTADVQGERLYAEISRGRGKVGVFMFNDQADRQDAAGLLRAVWGQIVDWSAEPPRTNPFAGTARLRSRELASLLHDASRDVGLPFIASLVGAYILLVGPGVYFLLKRWNRLPAVIWVEPLVIVAYLGIIFGVAYITKGVRTKTRVWNVISQIDGERAALRQGFLSIFSGDDATYRIECPRGDVLHPVGENEERPVVLSRDTDGRLALEGFHLAHWEQGHLTTLEVMDLEGVQVELSPPRGADAGAGRKAILRNLLPYAVLGGVLYDRRTRHAVPRIEAGASVEVPLPAEAADPAGAGRKGDAKEVREAWESLLARLEPVLQRGLGLDGYPVLAAWVDRRDEDFRLDRASTLRERIDLYLLYGKE